MNFLNILQSFNVKLLQITEAYSSFEWIEVIYGKHEGYSENSLHLF
jgi:hypothetical protein